MAGHSLLEALQYHQTPDDGSTPPVPSHQPCAREGGGVSVQMCAGVTACDRAQRHLLSLLHDDVCVLSASQERVGSVQKLLSKEQ